MKKVYIVIIACSIIGAIALLVFSIIFSEDLSNGIIIGAGLIGSLASIITMIVALLIYDKFGLDKKITDYQTESIFRLIEQIRNTSCKVQGKRMTYLIWFAVDLGDREPIIRLNQEESKKLLFTTSNDKEDPFNIYKHKYDIWLPKEVKSKLKFLDFWGTSTSEPSDWKADHLLSSFDNFEGNLFLMGKEMTLLEFIDNIEALKKEILIWLRKYSSVRLEINFD